MYCKASNTVMLGKWLCLVRWDHSKVQTPTIPVLKEDQKLYSLTQSDGICCPTMEHGMTLYSRACSQAIRLMGIAKHQLLQHSKVPGPGPVYLKVVPSLGVSDTNAEVYPFFDTDPCFQTKLPCSL